MSVKQILFTARPKGLPDASSFRLATAELPPLQPEELHLKGLYYTVDPYMRGRMSDVRSYSPPFELNKPFAGGVVAQVVESRDNGFKPGDIVLGAMLPWATEMVVPARAVRIIDTQLAPPSYYLGILGMPGLTAYCGLMVIGKPKPGENVVISGAAGAVGLVAGQIAKIQGCRVIGIAGSEEKVKMLKEEYGFDEALNYKTSPDLSAEIGRLCPDWGVDIYFDNVGGDVTDAVFPHLNFHARIPLCGQIAEYNSTKPPMGPRMQPIMLIRSVLMKGFLVAQFKEHHAEGVRYLSQYLKEGRLKYTETIIEGFEKMPEALLGLFSGQNTGKMVVKA